MVCIALMPLPCRWMPSSLLLLAGLAACGDDLDPDGACVSTEVDEFPDGPYGRPDDFILDESPCEPGSLAGVDLGGRWSILGEDQFGLEMPIVRETCRGGIEMDIPSYPDLLVHRDDTSLFWHSVDEGGGYRFVLAGRACAIPGSDELAVAEASCVEAPNEDLPCTVTQSRMKRFGRPEGEQEAEGLELVSEWSGGGEPWNETFSLNVKVADGVAFVARFGEVRLVDVSDPAHPSDLGAVPSEDDPGYDFNDVKLFEVGGATHAVLAGALSPVVDASDPTHPIITAKLGEYAHSVFVRIDDLGRPLAYLATYGPDVPIYDLSDPFAPALIDRVDLPVGVAVHDLYADEDHLYLNGSTAGLQVMERDGDGWSVAGALPSPYSHASWVSEVEGRRLAIVGDEGKDAYLHVIDVDPGSADFMTEVGSYQTRPEVSIHNMMWLGDRAYLTYYQDGVRILDMRDPSQPELLAYFHTWDLEAGGTGPFEGAIGLDVDVDAGLVYVADIERGLLILRQTDAGRGRGIVSATGRAGS
jgi:hypothetical protein